MPKYFDLPSQEFVYVRSYARWLEEAKRRETWEDSVERYMDYMRHRVGSKVSARVFHKINDHFLNMSAVGSMRALWAAGAAMDQSPTAGYNCTFLAVRCVEAFAETFYILMCGAGVGFSVEERYVNQLPIISDNSGLSSGTFLVPDTKEGWSDSVKALMQSLYSGSDLDMDYSLIRPAGSRLITMGGRSSGHGPLAICHDFIRKTMMEARGRRLFPLECHDILNSIADAVVAGGVRRSSQISLSDLDNEEMANAKVGDFPKGRFMANNSAIYHEKPTAARFLTEWGILANSGSGERGIFNMQAAKKMAPSRRNSNLLAGTNPCGEIVLRDCEMCNLSEVIARHDDDVDDLIQKVKAATWLGAIQSTITDFRYLRKEWRKNCEEERLLGTSITGHMDCFKLIGDPTVQLTLKKVAIKTAREAAKKLGINFSAAITCGKPSGTVSQLVECSSGAHPRWDEHYLRRYRINHMDPLYHMLKDQGLKFHPEIGQRRKDWNAATKGNTTACSIYDGGEKWTEDKVRTWVCEFPIKSPKQSVKRDDVTALDQLEHYKNLQENWCEHNQSITVYVRDEEWFEVGNWVYKHWDTINGVSFLPYDGGRYELAPYESITKEEYKQKKKDFPKLDYSQLSKYESEDNTEGSKTLACTGDKCELT